MELTLNSLFTILKLSLSVSLTPVTKLYVNESLSLASVVDKVPIIDPIVAFSLIVLLDNAKSVGASG